MTRPFRAEIMAPASRPELWRSPGARDGHGGTSPTPHLLGTLRPGGILLSPGKMWQDLLCECMR